MDEKDKSFSVYLSAEGFVNNAPMTKTYAKFKLRVLDQVSWNHVEESGIYIGSIFIRRNLFWKFSLVMVKY